MSVSNAQKSVPGSIEVRSIDYVPDDERHGGLASQFTLWLAANLQITAIVTGALAVVFGGDDAYGIVIFSCLIVIVTLFGYRLIHRFGRVASAVGIAAFVYMFSRLFATHDVSALLAERHFSLSRFLLAMFLSASWQIAYGPYVADYSRYLPRDTSVARSGRVTTYRRYPIPMGATGDGT